MPAPEPYAPVSALSADTLLEAAAMLPAFVAVLFLGSALLPGRRVTGSDADGERRVYKLNGLALFLIVAVAAGLAQVSGWFSLSMLHAHFAALFVVANAFAFALSGWLFFQGARARKGSQVSRRDFFMGVEAGPTWLGLDLKLFSYCPSLIGLALFNASFAAVQYETYGGLTLGMALYQVFTFLYVLNYFQFEQGMIHTWDIVSERFGWNLVWGDYVLVPFFYCLPGWWLVHAREPLSPVAAAAIVLLFVFGFWLFRGANQQKHRFKRDPDATIWGEARAVPGRPPSGLRVLGYRATSQLHRRDLHLPLFRPHHGACFLVPLPIAGLAGGSVVAPLEARRAPLPRQVRRVVGTLHAAGALFDAAVRPLRAETTNRAQTVTTPQSARGSLRSGNAAPELSGGWPLIGNPPEFQRDPVSMLSRG